MRCMKRLSRNKERTLVSSACFGHSIHWTHTAIWRCVMLQMSLNTAHKFFRGHSAHTDLFLSLIPTPASLPLLLPLTHPLCLARSLILRLYHTVSISHFPLSHTLRLASFFSFSRSRCFLYSALPLHTFPLSVLIPFPLLGPLSVRHCCPGTLRGASVTDTQLRWSP